VDAGFKRALVGIAGELQVLAFEGGVDQLYEADLRAASRRSLHLQLGRKVVPEAPLKLTSWRGTGGVDIAVHNAKGSGYEAIAELKLWRGKGKIDEALWDAWKLGSAYKEGLAWNAYLIAAGPASYWSSGAPALSFFDDGTHNGRESWTRFESSWQAWIKKTSGPNELPAGIRTKPIESVPIHLGNGEDWEIRCVRVSTTPGAPFLVPVDTSTGLGIA
jgi:hypothetical protein